MEIWICMIFFWPSARLFMLPQAWTQWHFFFNGSILQNLCLGNVFLARELILRKRVKSESWHQLVLLGVPGAILSTNATGNWWCCSTTRSTVLELGGEGRELPKARQVWPHNERYLWPGWSHTRSRNESHPPTRSHKLGSAWRFSDRWREWENNPPRSTSTWCSMDNTTRHPGLCHLHSKWTPWKIEKMKNWEEEG